MRFTGIRQKGAIPGFGIFYAVTVFMLLTFILIPLSSVFVHVFTVSPGEVIDILTSPPVIWAFGVTIGVSLLAAALNVILGTILAWTLEKYEFFGKGFMDALIELPFALPTAVAGITLSRLYSDTGLLGKLGLEFSYTHVGMVIALMFVGLPFTVRSVQPVLRKIPVETVEAASILGAGRIRTFFNVILPKLSGAIISGFGLSFARGIGEYGSIIYISGNSAKKHTQTVSYLIMQKLNVMDYSAASVLALFMLLISFGLLMAMNALSFSQSKKNADVLVSGSIKREKSSFGKLLTAVSAVYVFVMLILPLFTVVTQAFSKGVGFFFSSVTTEFALSALRVSLLCVLICVPIAVLFGIASGYLFTRFDFKGKKILITLTDVPFSVSPVIAGLSYLMMFGRLGWAYGITEALGIKIVFALPGVFLATLFVILPFVTREVVPELLASGKAEEEAASLMGAGTFFVLKNITVPKMRGALSYGIVLAVARCAGEFGAVAAVSKNRGKTFTLPLEIDALYYAGDKDSVTSAFALSLIMLFIAITVLILRKRLKRT